MSQVTQRGSYNLQPSFIDSYYAASWREDGLIIGALISKSILDRLVIKIFLVNLRISQRIACFEVK